jgi:hypothetical protein
MKKIARIFLESDGRYYICPEDGDFYDARGRGHNSKSSALRAAWRDGYTHAIGSGTYWGGVRSIPPRYRD